MYILCIYNRMYNVVFALRGACQWLGIPAADCVPTYHYSILFEDRVGQEAKAAIKIGASQTVKQIHARPWAQQRVPGSG